MRKIARFIVTHFAALIGLFAIGGAGIPGVSTQLKPSSETIPTSPPGRRTVVYPMRTMGTYANVNLVTADSAASAPNAQRAHANFARVDSLMSNWTTTSEVARLNRGGGSGATPVHPEVAVVLDEAIRVWRESDGAQDITVEPLVRLWGFLGGPRRVPSPSEVDSVFPRIGSQHLAFDRSSRTLRYEKRGVQIDLGGIAKGHAVDAAAETLDALGVRDALVDLSGNMFALGSPPSSKPWRIGIRDPRDRIAYFARLQLFSRQAIATSGKYEQFVAADGETYGHIMDPRTGRPAAGLISVTVIAPSAMAADAWDTGLFVLGADAAKRKALAHPELEVVLVEPGRDGIDTVWVERSLEDRFSLEADARALFRVEYF
ncbi:MAG TPA: FAD:protein FMN transferase [Candidatus Limnocylindria bacterium]|nr:FAD:protein FMN transferase [Candidatus Limnocylindria bacterium]